MSKKRFDEFKFEPDMLSSLSAMGFKECTPIQEQAIPVILDHKDLIGSAQTGTGKTAAFLLPVLSHLIKKQDYKIDTLIIVPTRELAIQIDQQIEGFSYYTEVTSVGIYGGGDKGNWETQKKALEQGTDIVITTPGRFLQHLGFNYTDLSGVKHLILDEADRMLDMGFYDDIMNIIKMLPKERQTLLFSATMPPKIRKLALTILNKPEEISIAVSKPAEKILQIAYMVYETQKVALTKKLLVGQDHLRSVVIFLSRKIEVNQLARELNRSGLSAGAIHSDLDQSQREDVLRKFKGLHIQILVATDIIARGIDIDSIDLVINYNVPSDPADYVHRIGRTARASAEGIGITYVSDKDQAEFKAIEDLIEKEIVKLPTHPEIGESPKYDPSKSRGKRRYGNKNKRR